MNPFKWCPRTPTRLDDDVPAEGARGPVHRVRGGPKLQHVQYAGLFFWEVWIQQPERFLPWPLLGALIAGLSAYTVRPWRKFQTETVMRVKRARSGGLYEKQLRLRDQAERSETMLDTSNITTAIAAMIVAGTTVQALLAQVRHAAGRH